ncbi:MAG: sensor histidine kinase [Anaerolineales bacterium]
MNDANHDELRKQIRAELEAEYAERDIARLRLLSLTAHELAAPTTTVKGYVQILDQGLAGELSPRQQQMIQSTLRNVERMERMISDLRDFARLERKQLDLFPESFAIHTVVYETVGTLMEDLRAAKVDLHMAVSDDLPRVYADRTRAAQIVTNLLSNAVKYTREAGHITVAAEADNGFVRLSVSDTGVGIDPAEQEKLFEPFFRSEDPFVRARQGTGLGLVIVRMLVEQQGGAISFESTPGEGSTFAFTLPVSGTG